MSALHLAQLFPAERHGHRCPDASPQRERGHRRGAAAAGQVVDEDLALLESLGRGGHKPHGLHGAHVRLKAS